MERPCDPLGLLPSTPFSNPGLRIYSVGALREVVIVEGRTDLVQPQTATFHEIDEHGVEVEVAPFSSSSSRSQVQDTVEVKKEEIPKQKREQGMREETKEKEEKGVCEKLAWIASCCVS